MGDATHRPLGWAGYGTASAQAWVWSEPSVPTGSHVIGRLRAADGAVLAEQSWTVADPATDPRPVGTLQADLTAARETGLGVVVWEADWRGPDDASLDRDAVLASTGPDLWPLLHLACASMQLTTRRGGDPSAWRVQVRHVGGLSSSASSAATRGTSAHPAGPFATATPARCCPVRNVPCGWGAVSMAGVQTSRAGCCWSPGTPTRP